MFGLSEVDSAWVYGLILGLVWACVIISLQSATGAPAFKQYIRNIFSIVTGIAALILTAYLNQKGIL